MTAEFPHHPGTGATAHSAWQGWELPATTPRPQQTPSLPRVRWLHRTDNPLLAPRPPLACAFWQKQEAVPQYGTLCPHSPSRWHKAEISEAAPTTPYLIHA